MHMQEEYRYSELTEKIIGCAFKVHRYFGMGFREEIYERSLLIELNNAGLKSTNQRVADVYYYEALVGKKRLDILVEDKVLIELKAVTELEDCYTNQLLNYLNVFNIEVGLLFNFGNKSLKFKRFANTKKSP